MAFRRKKGRITHALALPSEAWNRSVSASAQLSQKIIQNASAMRPAFYIKYQVPRDPLDQGGALVLAWAGRALEFQKVANAEEPPAGEFVLKLHLAHLYILITPNSFLNLLYFEN